MSFIEYSPRFNPDFAPLTILEQAQIVRTSFNTQAKLVGQLADTITDLHGELADKDAELEELRYKVRQLRHAQTIARIYLTQP